MQNFGDELLRDIYVQWLSGALPNAELTMLKFRGLRSSHADWRSEFEGADALLFLGGGYFGEADHPGMNVFKRSLKKITWGLRNDRLYGGAFHHARRHDIPHAVIGVEVGPLSRGFYRRHVTQILESANVCTVRSTESLQFARKYGVRRSDIDVCADAVLTLDRNDLPNESLTEMKYVLAKGEQVAPREEFRIGLHLSSLGESHWQQRDRLVEVIRQIKQHVPDWAHVSLFFVHDQVKDGQHPKSAVDAEEFFKEHFPDMAVPPYHSHWGLVGLLGAMNLVVTTKLHVGITARALSVPVLSIPRHQKTPRFYRLIGEEWSCMALEQLSSVGIAPYLQSILQTWKVDQLFPVSPQVRQSAQRNREVLVRFVEGLD